MIMFWLKLIMKIVIKVCYDNVILEFVMIIVMIKLIEACNAHYDQSVSSSSNLAFSFF